MKTNGSVCTRASLSGFVIALFISIPVSSQVSFTSPGNTLFTYPGRERFMASEISYAEAISGVRQRHSTVTIFMSAYDGNINDGGNAGEESKITTEKAITSFKSKPTTSGTLIRFKPTSFNYPKNTNREIGITEYATEQLLLYAKSLKDYATKNGYDTTYVFLGNMGMLSNSKRFFVVNLETMKVEMSGLVSHGRGTGSIFDKQYSNTEGSRCTSLGKYKITGKYKGGYGISYRMAGLDSSNKNAYHRNIVLHSMMCIPDVEKAMPACVSEGCPSVSAKFFASLSKIIDSRRKPVLLWLFDSNLEEVVFEETSPNDQYDKLEYAKNNLKKKK